MIQNKTGGRLGVGLLLSFLELYGYVWSCSGTKRNTCHVLKSQGRGKAKLRNCLFPRRYMPIFCFLSSTCKAKKSYKLRQLFTRRTCPDGPSAAAGLSPRAAQRDAAAETGGSFRGRAAAGATGEARWAWEVEVRWNEVGQSRGIIPMKRSKQQKKHQQQQQQQGEEEEKQDKVRSSFPLWKKTFFEPKNVETAAFRQLKDFSESQEEAFNDLREQAVLQFCSGAFGCIRLAVAAGIRKKSPGQTENPRFAIPNQSKKPLKVISTCL